MLKNILLLSTLVHVCILGFPQFNLNKLKDITDKAGINIDYDKAQKAILDKTFKEISEQQKDYEMSSFTTAISLSDNSSLFENDEKLAKNKNRLYSLVQTQNKEQNADKAIADNLKATGEIFYASAKFYAAEKAFLSAKDSYEKAGAKGSAEFANTIANLGLLYENMGRYPSSEDFTNYALELRKTLFGENHITYAATLNNKAVLYKEQGKFLEAEKLMDQTINIAKASGNQQEIYNAIFINNKAMLLQNLGRNEEAEKLLKTTIEIAEKRLKKDAPNLIRFKTNLAFLYKEMGKYPESEALFLENIDLMRKRIGSNHPDYAQMLNNLASLYMLMKKYDEVQAKLTTAADIFKSKLGEEHPAYASTIHNLGAFFLYTNNIEKATPYIHQAVEIRKKVLGENNQDYLNSLENEAILLWKQNKIDEAHSAFIALLDKEIDYIQTFFTSFSENEKAKLWHKIQPKFDHFFAFCAENANQKPLLKKEVYNYRIATKGILINATTKIKNQILASNNQDLIKKYNLWLDKKNDLLKAYSLSKAEQAEQKVNVDSLEHQSNRLEKELVQSDSAFNEKYINTKINQEIVSKKLKTGESAVEIIRFKRILAQDSLAYMAIILKPNLPDGKSVNPDLILLKNGADLENKYLKYYKNKIKNKEVDEYSYNQYWKAIDQTLAGSKKVYLSLDGVYNQISINTLSKNPNQYIIDQYTITYITSTKNLAESKNTKFKNTKTAILIGNPTFGTKGDIAPLPATKTEIVNISTTLVKQKYITTKFTEAAATETNLKKANKPTILHIATHGFFQKEVDETSSESVFGIEASAAKQNPLLRAGLLLAGAENYLADENSLESGEHLDNGIFTAYEAMNLNLQNTELVLLSACETGQGEIKNGEGVYGFQRAFQIAGSKAIMMSLWKVNDNATQLLSSEFYKNWLLGQSKIVAFRNAQKTVQLTYQEPYYWGAFVLIGE